MAKLRKASAYKRIERPYTRRSKFRKKNFVRANPNNLIVKYEMGSPTKQFPVKLLLIVDEDCQIRHNAFEAARKSANRLLENKLLKNFFLKYRIFPHHILRENPLASGAGADRMSTGMKMSFGKPIGLAAQCKKGKILAELHVDEKDLELGITALKRMQYKFPVHCLIERENVVVKKKKVVAKLKKAPESKEEAPKAEEPKKEAPVVEEKPEPVAEEKPAEEAPKPEATPVEKPALTKDAAEAKEILKDLKPVEKKEVVEVSEEKDVVKTEEKS